MLFEHKQEAIVVDDDAGADDEVNIPPDDINTIVTIIAPATNNNTAPENALNHINARSKRNAVDLWLDMLIGWLNALVGVGKQVCVNKIN